MPVVVVESPAKAKTINKYLGSDYTVLASYGHVRDLALRKTGPSTLTMISICCGRSHPKVKNTSRQ